MSDVFLSRFASRVCAVRIRSLRQLGFVKFFAVEAAQDYMEKHHPVVMIGENKVKIAYSLGRGEEDNGWTCDKVHMIYFLYVHLLNVLFSAPWSIFRDEKYVIDVDSLGVVWISVLWHSLLTIRCGSIITTKIAYTESLGL